MSRSYRKTPISRGNNRREKVLANRRVRHSVEVPNGKQYRKFYNSYDITDTVWGYTTLSEVVKSLYRWSSAHIGEEITPEYARNEINRWFKYYRRK